VTPLSIRQIHGLAGVPTTKFGLRKWLARQALPITMDGNRFTFHLSDLPAPGRRAYVEREIASMGMPQGTYDEAAHADFATLPATMRAVAERKAEIARVLVAAGKGLSWADKVALVMRRFGADGVSQPSLMRISKAVEGVDPINFAPALVAAYRLEGPHQLRCRKVHGHSS
jgi:putative transposase